MMSGARQYRGGIRRVVDETLRLLLVAGVTAVIRDTRISPFP